MHLTFSKTGFIGETWALSMVNDLPSIHPFEFMAHPITIHDYLKLTLWVFIYQSNFILDVSFTLTSWKLGLVNPLIVTTTTSNMSWKYCNHKGLKELSTTYHHLSMYIKYESIYLFFDSDLCENKIKEHI